MIKKVIVGAAVAAMLAMVPTGTAFATGQPGAGCGDEGATMAPPGFSSGGFANAEAHYAGSDGTPSLANGSPNAVSQYDIACVNFTSAHS